MGEQEPKAPDGGFKAGAKSFLAGGAGGMSLVLVGLYPYELFIF